MSQINEEILESCFQKYNFFKNVPEFIIGGNFSIVLLAVIDPQTVKELVTIKPILPVFWVILCLSFLIFSVIKKSNLEEKIVEIINKQDTIIKNVKEVKLLKTSKKIHEAEVTFENDEIEIMELIIVENAELTKDVIEYKKIPKAIYKNRNFSDKLNIPILNIRNQEKIVVATTTLTK